MAENEERPQDHDERALHDEELDPDVEAQGMREVMTAGLAAAAFVGGSTQAKAADAPVRTAEQTVLVEKASLDRDLDGYLTFSELEQAGYKANVELLNADGYDVTVADLDAAGYKVSSRLLDAFTDADTVMLKVGIDQGLDLMLEAGVADWPNKLSAIDADDDGLLTFAELEEAGYKATVEPLLSEGYDVTLERLEAAGIKIQPSSLYAFLADAQTVALKRGIDHGLDTVLDYGVDAWPSKLAKIDADGDGYLTFEELERSGHAVSVATLQADGYDVTLADLDAAGYKIHTSLLHEFMVGLDTVALKDHVDPGLDAVLDKASPV